MHELSLMQGVLDAITPVAHDNGAIRVTGVTLQIGEMTQVVEEAMRFAFEALTEGDSLYDGAELTLEFVKPASKCLDCGNEFEHDRFHLKCPSCGSGATMLTAGREMSVASIEIEDEEE